MKLGVARVFSDQSQYIFDLSEVAGARLVALHTPATLISEHELNLLRNPQVVAALHEAHLGDPSTLRRRRAPRRKQES